jgi:PAS domain S-box-containing protein
MNKIIKNTLTGKEITRPTAIDEEVIFEGGVMITETDTAGIITYANRKFREMTGYSKEVLIGSSHNINRHPDMPKEAFHGLWKTIKQGKYWEGFVKNLRADGKYYIVLVFIKPKFDKDKKIIGYIAGRKVADKDLIKRAFQHYKTLKTL